MAPSATSASLSRPFFPRKPCEGDSCKGHGQPTYFCVHCDSSFCEECWDNERPHRPGKRGADGLAHEKTDLLVVERYRNILEGSSDPGEQEALHKDDEDTTWFGIGRDVLGAPIFEDYGRYAALMAESLTSAWHTRYPRLVSFIGQTGKELDQSTRVMINIDRCWQEYPRQDAH